MTQPLSPAAQAVLDAYMDEDRAGRLAVAAALRAAADQVVPNSKARSSRAAVIRRIRRDLLTIAAELEGGQVTPVKPEFPPSRRVSADLL